VGCVDDSQLVTVAEAITVSFLWLWSCPIDGVGGIVFCACLSVYRPSCILAEAFLTGLLSTSLVLFYISNISILEMLAKLSIRNESVLIIRMNDRINFFS